jgi:hypothetical protein
MFTLPGKKKKPNKIVKGIVYPNPAGSGHNKKEKWKHD